MDLLIRANAFDDPEASATPIGQRLPLDTWFLPCNQIKDARRAAAKLLLGDAREQIPTHTALLLDGFLDCRPGF